MTHTKASRNPDQYETITTEDGKEVTFLKSNNTVGAGGEKQKLTKEEEENIAKAAEIMQDRDD